MKILKGLFVTALMASTLAMADPPSVHGMLLFGDKVSYASHLPMFHAPHDYQLIMKLTLEDHGSDTLITYEQSKSEGATLFTLVPEVMDLTQLIDGTKKSFSATIFQGHFERGGKPLGEVAVNVEKIVFAEKLNGNQPSSHNESYLLFGENGEYFSAHIIKGKPSFDAVMSVSKPVKMDYRTCRRVDCTMPNVSKVSDSQLPLTLISALHLPPIEGDSLGNPFGGYVSVESVIYLEENELAH